MTSAMKRLVKSADEELKILLEQVPRSYFDFVISILDDVKKGKMQKDDVVAYLKNNPEATTSEVIDYCDDLMGIPRL